MSAPGGVPPLPAGVSNHPRFFYEDGNVLLLVQHHIYCIHRSRVVRLCQGRGLAALLDQPFDALLPGWKSLLSPSGEQLYVNWESREITSSRPCIWDEDSGALRLPDVTVRELDAFLSAIDSTDFVTHDLNNQEECEAALSLAIRWSCTSVEQLALTRLDTYTERSHAERLALARTYNIQNWIRPALRALCLRPQPLTLDELRHLQPHLGDVELIIRTREESRNDIERDVDYALDAWERSLTAIPELDAGRTAFPQEPSHVGNGQGANTPLHANPATSAFHAASHSALPGVAVSGAPVSVESIPGSPALDASLAPGASVLVHIPEAFPPEPLTSGDLESDALAAALNASATETGALEGSEDEGAGPVDTTGFESIASRTARNTSLAGVANDSGAATVESGLLNFGTPAVQPTGPGSTPELTTEFTGGQLIGDEALSPIDDRFEGSAMQSRALSPRNDEEEFDPARSPTTSVAPVPPSSTRADQERLPVGEGSWRGEGLRAAWSARSSSEDPKVPGAHKDDSISKTASSDSAATSSPLKTIMNFVATTAGLFAGSGSTDSPRPVRNETPLGPEGQRRDKGKGRQVETGSTAVVVVGPVSATDSPTRSWQPSHEAQTSGASLGRQGEEVQAEAEVVGNAREERGGMSDEDEGDDGNGNEDEDDGGDDTAIAQASAAVLDQADPSEQNMTDEQRKKLKRKRDKAKEKAKKAGGRRR